MMKVILMLLVLLACGKEKDTKPPWIEEEISEDGLYVGKVLGLNKSRASGSIRINVIGDSVEVTVTVTGVPAGTQNYLYESSFCPSRSQDVRIQSGNRLLSFEQGTQETSYSVLLADLGRRAIYFDDRTFIVYAGAEAVGCADIDRFWDTPEDQPAPRPRPRRPHRREPDYGPPPPPPPPEQRPSWWERLSDRLRQWWCRVRHRCG